MAGGNLGDLWFQLGVKDNTSKELQKIIDKLKTGDDAANSLLRALQGFGTRKSGFKEQAEKAKEFADVLNEINRSISKLKKNDKSDEAKNLQTAVKNALSYLDMLQRINIERSKISELRSLNPNVDTSKLKEAELMLENVNNQLYRLQNKAQGGGGGGVDYANVLQDYAKVLQMTFRDVKQITDQFKKENPLSAFSGGAAKVEADISRVTEKLAKMRDLMAEGALKGFNTNMLGGSITELDKILARLQAASGNKSILTDAAQMKNLLSDVAVEMTKATAATQAYGREKGKVIAQEREFAAASKLSAKDNDAELRALSDYAKRYMALQEAKRKAEKQASDERKRQSEAEARRIEADTERMSRLYAKMSLVIGRGERAGMRSLELGVNTSTLEKALSDATELKKRIEDANIALMGKGGRPAYSSYVEEVNRLSSSLANATQAQRDLNSAQDKANRKAEAQAIKDAAKAKREDIAAEKQRQNELKNTERRYDSLGNKVRQLRSEYSRGISIGADVSKAEGEILRLISAMRRLQYIKDNLSSPTGWKDYLGQLGNIGSGHDITLASRVLQDQKAVNREVQKGIELERKRQQEIAQSAARARNDLAAALAGANAEAKKMQSVIGDIKSLFLQGGIVFGAQQFFNSIVQTGGEIVQQHVALRSILGDVQKADELFAQTQQLALQSPFKFGELNRDTKQLAAFGVEAKDLYETTKRLADIASGLGVDFGRLGLAFGQVKARSWLDGKELRQFAYAGLPLLEKITELYNAEGKNNKRDYTQSDVKEMISKRMVSFEDMQKVLWKMTDEGGQFYNMQFVLSETLLGKWNKLIDAWEIMLGKFADGDNIVGGFFKLAISGVTELVLALDKMSPAILSMGAVRLLGMLGKNTFGASKLSNQYSQQLNTQLRAYAIEQQQLVTEKKITQEKALQNVQARGYLLADKESQMAAYSRMALEGKLSVNQMNRLLREGLITKELVEQLTVMGLIDASQEKAIISGSRLSAIWSTARTKFGSALSFVGGWWGLAIGAVVGIWSSISREMDEVEQKAKSLQDANSEWMKPYYDILSQDKSSNDSELKKQVESMKQLLISSNAYTKTIADQIEKAKSLNEQYDILKSGVEAAKNTAYGDASVVANAIGATGGVMSGKPFNDTITENINDMQSSMTKLDLQLSALDQNTKAKMESIANSLLLPADRSKTLAEKIRILSEEGGQRWAVFQAGMVKWNKNIAFSMTRIKGAAEDVTSDIQEIASDDVPAIVNSMQKDLGLFGDDFRRFCKTQPDRFRNMLLQIASDAYWLVPQIRKKLEELTGYRFPDKGKITSDTPLNSMQRRVFANLGGNQKQYDLISSYLTDGSYYKTKNNLQNALQDLYNEYKSRTKGGATKSEIAEARREFDTLNDAAFRGLGYKFIPQDKKSNRVPKVKTRTGSQEDKQLKNLRNRIDLYKKMYAEIKKYKELFGEGALGQLANDGEFKAIFNDKRRFPISDYTNYETSIKELLRTLHATTKDRLDYAANEKAGIQTENRKLLEDQRRDELDALNRQLDIISEQYETYKKIYELTGNKKGSENLAFGGTVQFDTYKRFLEEQLDIAVKHDNVQSGLNLTMDEVKGMSLENVKDKYGEESRVYDIRKKLEDENNKIKKETIDLMANLIEKNATIAQQIEDENRKYERQLELIKGIEDPQMRDRAKAGATKTHNENVAKLQFEQFKQESDWVTIFDDLDRVSSATISSMITKIDNFSRTTGLPVEVVKQLRDALDKLRKEDIDRNPLPYIFEAVNQGNAIGGYLKGNLGAQYMNGKKYVPTAEQAKKMGIEWSAAGYSKNELESEQKGKYADSSYPINALAGKFKALESALDPVIGLFKAMGEEDSILGQITGGASNAVSSAANTVGTFNTLSTVKGLGFLEGVGPYAAAASAAFSIGSSLFKAFGADYSSYNKAKAEYENLTSIWDTLISKKTEYMNIHWGTEAANASKEAQEMMESEIKQTKVIAMKNFNSGASAGSHSIKVRDWEKRGWKEAAPEISKRYGVKFDSMTDILDIDNKVLQQIKKDYAELWANLDEDSRTYLDKLIEYGEKSEDMIESLTEKLTGNKYSDLVSAWGDAMATMSNTSDNLVDHFEENLRNVILKSMIENLYGEKIKALIEKTKKYGDPNGGTEKKLDTATGKVMSEYTNTEMDEIGKDLADVTKQIEASRDYLKRYYGWSDNSSSSLTNSVKGITEETGDLIASYLNSIRLDVSVIREEQVKCMSESNEIAKSQLTQLNFISANTLRNAEAAERIERVFEEYSSNFNMVINGVKSIKVR